MGPYDIWVIMGPYGWPKVNKNNVEQVKSIISDKDFFLGLSRGTVGTEASSRQYSQTITYTIN